MFRNSVPLNNKQIKDESIMTEEITRIARKANLKNNSGIDSTKETHILKSALTEMAKTTPRVESAIGLNEKARSELTEYIGDAERFPLADLEKTIEYIEQLTESISPAKKGSTDRKTFLEFSARLSAAQWHFTEVSKRLTAARQTDNIRTSYIGLRATGNFDYPHEMIETEHQNLLNIIPATKKALYDKNMSELYKCNEDLITVVLNLTLIIQYHLPQ